MHNLSKAAIVAIVGLSTWGIFTTTASANSQYSAARSNSVKLVWRRSMGRHALIAAQGARYSKHLGVRYSNNYATASVTWYTDAHEKLYNYRKRTSAIYYHVKSTDGALQGWIWRGYLKTPTVTTKPTTPVKKTTTSNTSSETQSGELWYAKTSAQYAKAIQTESAYKLANAVWKLFPGTKLNLWLSRDASHAQELSGLQTKSDDPDEVRLKSNLINYYKKNGISNPNICVTWALGHRSQDFANTFGLPLNERMTDMIKAMNHDGLTPAKRASFRGWYIGLDMADTNPNTFFSPNQDPNSTSRYSSSYSLILAPADSFQTINND